METSEIRASGLSPAEVRSWNREVLFHLALLLAPPVLFVAIFVVALTVLGGFSDRYGPKAALVLLMGLVVYSVVGLILSAIIARSVILEPWIRGRNIAERSYGDEFFEYRLTLQRRSIGWRAWPIESIARFHRRRLIRRKEELQRLFEHAYPGASEMLSGLNKQKDPDQLS